MGSRTANTDCYESPISAYLSFSSSEPSRFTRSFNSCNGDMEQEFTLDEDADEIPDFIATIIDLPCDNSVRSRAFFRMLRFKARIIGSFRGFFDS